MGSLAWGCVTDFFTYETTKSVVVKSWSVGIINRIVQLLIIAYFVGWVFLHEKAYQVTDTGIESSVMTKGTGVFCIMTKLIITENQFQGKCAESGEKFNCSRDEDCHKHFGTILSNGIITGVCLQDYRRCEIQGWCPTENDDVEIEPMLDIDNFTIFIKNSIRFPLFDVTRGNFPSSMTSQEIKSCTFHPVKNPFCPIFRVGDVLNYTKQTTKDLAQACWAKYFEKTCRLFYRNHFLECPNPEGGEIGINIQWKCNLDLNIEECVPQYSFTRLDKPFEKNAVSKGYNFRFAKYFKTENGTEFRTLHKVFAIRFDVMVTGSAGKFNTIPTLINLVAAFTSVGLGTVLCDIILLNFLKGAEQYKAKKFEEVSDAQIEASLAQSPVSQLSLKTGIKSSYDSGALSLATSDQPL